MGFDVAASADTQRSPQQVAALQQVALGNRAIQAGQVDAALQLFHAALSLDPECFVARANLGAALLAAQRWPQADAMLRAALELRPDEAPLHAMLGIACAGNLQFDAAAQAFRRALDLNPNDLETWRRLGEACRRSEQFEEGEAAFRHVLAQRPDWVEALVGMGDLYRVQARVADAEPFLLRALALAPDDPAALYSLGHCKLIAGDVTAAATQFEHAIAAKPDHVDAWYRLGMTRRRPGTPNSIARLEALFAQLPAWRRPQRVRYWFALGKLREDVGRYDEAFAAYAEGNHQHRLMIDAERWYPQLEAKESAFIDAIIDAYRADLSPLAADDTFADAPTPIFIVGMPRSGSTLIEQILAAHSAVHGGGEMTDLPEVVAAQFKLEREGAGDVAYPEIVPSLRVEDWHALGRAYLDRVLPKLPVGTRWFTDKLPGNYLHVGLIRRALPHARIVHSRRDARDTCFSCFANMFSVRSVPFTYDLATLGRYYARYRRLLAHWRDVVGTDGFLDVDYEAMVSDTEAGVRRLLACVGLPWDEGCLAFHRTLRSVRTVSVGQVSQPMYRTSLARWEHFAPHLAPLLDALAGDGRVDTPSR